MVCDSLLFSYGFISKIDERGPLPASQFSAPSVLLRNRRLRLAGHVIRAEDCCPESLQEILLLSLQGPRRRGQGRARSFLQVVFEDAR